MAERDRWLTLGQVADLWRQAGLPESESTLRRMIDEGEFGDVYRTTGRFRMVRESAVRRVIVQRTTQL